METAALEFNFIYTLLNILLLLVAIWVGDNVQKGGNYRVNASVFTFLYSLIVGLRFNRGNDYQHYIEVFQYDLEKTQIVYSWFIHILKYVGVGPHFSFIYYAAVFCICFFVFLTDYKKYARILVPLFLICFIWFEEFIIRQCLSWSFIFVLLKELNEFSKPCISGNRELVLLIEICFTVLIIYGIHSANIIVAIVIIFFFFYGHPIPWTFSIPLYIFASYIFCELFRGDLFTQTLLSLEGYDSKLDQFANQGSDWFDTANNVTKDTRQGLMKLLESWGNIVLIYYGYIITKWHKEKTYIAIYNTYVFGTIFRHAFFYLEILHRIGYVLEVMWFLPLTLILSELNRLRLNMTYQKMILLGLLFFISEYVKYVAFRRADRMLFLWDVMF